MNHALPDPNADYYAGSVLTAAETEQAQLRLIAADLTRAGELRARRGDRRGSENLRHAAHLVSSITEKEI